MPMADAPGTHETTGLPATGHPSWDQLLAECGLPRLEARALLEHASEKPRSWLIAHGDEAAPAAVAGRFRQLAGHRRAGEPIAYLTGWREFHGLRLRVSPDVLIPRADTETLVDLAIALAPPGARLLDLGTGSGAIAIAIAAARPDLAVTATDRSDAALAVARDNARSCLAGQALPRLLAGDWWAALPAGEPPFELIVSNPPYIPDGDAHLVEGDLRAEPRQALASGEDGLDDLRRIVAGAPSRLTPGGHLLVEHGYDQGPAVRDLFQAAGFEAIATVVDAGQRDRVTHGRWPA